MGIMVINVYIITISTIITIVKISVIAAIASHNLLLRLLLLIVAYNFGLLRLGTGAFWGVAAGSAVEVGATDGGVGSSCCWAASCG
jgi:hypothetical protein